MDSFRLLSDQVEGAQRHKELDSRVLLEHNCSFRTDLLISRLRAGNVLVLQVLRSRNISGGSAWPDGKPANRFSAFFGENHARCDAAL